MIEKRRSPPPGGAAAQLSEPPTLDGAAADALAVLTLLVNGDGWDSDATARMLSELHAEAGGAGRLMHGSLSLNAALLALLEFYGGPAPASALRELGRLIATAREQELGSAG